MGFLCHLSMTYEQITPYLKGIYLTLSDHLPQQDDDGWKQTDRQWRAYIHQRLSDRVICQTSIWRPTVIRGEYHPGCDCPARNSGLPSGIKSKFQTLSGFQIPCQISIHILDWNPVIYWMVHIDRGLFRGFWISMGTGRNYLWMVQCYSLV